MEGLDAAEKWSHSERRRPARFLGKLVHGKQQQIHSPNGMSSPPLFWKKSAISLPPNTKPHRSLWAFIGLTLILHSGAMGRPKVARQGSFPAILADPVDIASMLFATDPTRVPSTGAHGSHSSVPISAIVSSTTGQFCVLRDQDSMQVYAVCIDPTHRSSQSPSSLLIVVPQNRNQNSAAFRTPASACNFRLQDISTRRYDKSVDGNALHPP